MANKIIKPRPRPGSANKITKESLIGSMTESDVLKAIEEGTDSMDIGSGSSGGTRGMNPFDNYSKEDLMRLLGSLSGVAVPRMSKMAKRMRPQKMEDGGVAGGKVPKKYKGFSKLPEKVQEKISPDLADKYEYGGKVKGKKRKKSKGNMCRGGGAALRGTKFSGTK